MHNKKGFTLIETIIYMAIVGLVLVTLVQFSITVAGSRNTSTSIQEVQANARIAMNTVAQKIRASDGVNTSTSVFGTDPGLLSLSMADASKNPTIIALSVDDGVLEIKEGASASSTITSSLVSITNLVFTDTTGSSTRSNIHIDLTASYADAETLDFTHSQTLETVVSLRQ